MLNSNQCVVLALLVASFLTGCKTSSLQNSSISSIDENRKKDDRYVLEALNRTNQPEFQRMVIFGDSLSDETNLKRITLGLVPNTTYFQGRFSNGPVWVEYLEKSFNLPVLNLATGAATQTFEARQLVIPNVFPGLKGVPLPASFPRAVTNSVADHLRSKDFNPNGTLYVIWSGINDLFAGVSDTNHIVTTLRSDIEKVILAGGKKFLIPMMFSVDGLPRNLAGGSIKRPSDETLIPLIIAFNSQLALEISDLKKRYPEIKITQAQTNDLLDLIKRSPELLALSNIQDACYVGDFIPGTGGADKVCGDSLSYAFWDKVHPSTKLHCALAVNFIDALQQDQQLRGVKVDLSESLARCRSITGHFD